MISCAARFHEISKTEMARELATRLAAKVESIATNSPFRMGKVRIAKAESSSNSGELIGYLDFTRLRSGFLRVRR
jgi:hypothetical protein